MVSRATQLKRVGIEESQNTVNDQVAEDTSGNDFTNYVDTTTGRAYKKRGVTKLQDIWNMNPNEKIQVQVNKFNVPVGVETSVLSSFIGTIARNDVLVPVDFATWKKKELDPYKIQILRLTSFSYPQAVEKYILSKANISWKNHKSDLKGEYFVEDDMEKVFERPTPPGILEAHWRNLVASWYTEAAKKIAEINIANANKLKMHHTSGRKSFAIVSDEIEKATGKAPNRLELFKITHKKPNDHMKKLIEYADALLATGEVDGEQVFRKVFPAEHGGRVRGVGSGPTPKSFFGPCFSTDVGSTAHDVTSVSTDQKIESLSKIVVELQKEVATLKAMRSENSPNMDGGNTQVHDQSSDMSSASGSHNTTT